MPLNSLRITDFRNLATVNFSPSPQGLNIIHGENGSGKTSLLEAIYYLSLGRSFRSATASRLIRQGTPKFSIVGQLVSDLNRLIPLGVERELSGVTRLRVAEQEVTRMAELAALLPIRLIHAQSHHLLESGPLFRRAYLDWGLFYQSDAFLLTWRQFERTLKQRNTLLRSKCTKPELASFTAELVKHGQALNQWRQAYVQALTPFLAVLVERLLGFTQVAIHYHAGWEANTDYATVLGRHFHKEMQLGYTYNGPHRADFDITINTVSVKHFLSRGQQKLLICAMIIAQGMLLAATTNKSLIYLVDDLPSELDLSSKTKLITLLAEQQTQVFITAIESKLPQPSLLPSKMFHVERGSLEEVALGSF